MDILCEPPFSLPATFDAVDDAIDANADVAEAILAAGLTMFGVQPRDESWKGKATSSDVDKARSTIRQLYRDWSAEGLPERHAAYAPLFKALERHLIRHPPSQRHKNRVLVPGAGLGRLVFDLCLAGYTVEGNEISHHQLITSNYVLNAISKGRKHKIFPWALNFSNHLTRANQLQHAMIPDVHPETALEGAALGLSNEVHYSKRMSVTAGDFCEVYKEPRHTNAFDAVTTCFFIDTAPNVIRYIETIHHCLKPGGLWINLGPLLWHFEATPTPHERQRQRNGSTAAGAGHTRTRSPSGICEPGSFELSNDEVISLVEKLGFTMVESETAAATGYIQDTASMLQSVYRPAFWVAQKQ